MHISLVSVLPSSAEAELEQSLGKQLCQKMFAPELIKFIIFSSSHKR